MVSKGSRKASRKGSRKASRKGSRKASRKGSRKGSRKASRKASRKSRKGSRKSRKGSRKSRKGRRCGMWGGAYDAAALSRAQGEQFLSNYPTQRAQSGGAYGNYTGNGAPVGDQGLLDPALRDMARIQPLDTKLTEINGMRDPDQMGGMPTMSGGRRRNTRKSKKSKKSKKDSRKSKKSKKSKKSSRKGRSQRGGSHGNYSGAGQPMSAPNMLLSSSDAAKAGTADFSNPLLKN